METTTCLFCGVNDERALLRRATPRHVVCRRCGLVYQNPRPTFVEMQSHYHEGYWEDRGLDRAPLQPTDADLNTRGAGIVEMLRGRTGSNDLVVEVGCGQGEILAQIRAVLGCRVLGIEPSVSQTDLAKQRFGIEIRCSGLEEMDLGGDKAQVFVLSHVLEHIYEPLAAISRLRDALVDAGWLLIEVPNMLHPHRRKRLSNWLAREHVYNFTRDSLTRLLAMAGFRAVQIEEKHYLRILAQRTASENHGLAPGDAVSSEYWRVRRAVLKHELFYWPWYALRRVGLIGGA
jgi:SAM-dependent methyltransferase